MAGEYAQIRDSASGSGCQHVTGWIALLVVSTVTAFVMGAMAMALLGPAGGPKSGTEPDATCSFCIHSMGAGRVGSGGDFGPIGKGDKECHDELAHYFANGQYLHDVKAVADKAIATVQQLITTHSPSASELFVFDIDETVLSNRAEWTSSQLAADAVSGGPWARLARGSLFAAGQQLEQGKALKEVMTARALRVGDAPALEAMRDFYRFLYASGYSVAFITGRNESFRNMTLANLASAGYGQPCPSARSDGQLCESEDCKQKGKARPVEPCFVALMMRGPGDVRLASVYKPEQRAKLASAGYDVVGSSGDQFSDLEGEHSAPYCFKLPNPAYLIL